MPSNRIQPRPDPLRFPQLRDPGRCPDKHFLHHVGTVLLGTGETNAEVVDRIAVPSIQLGKCVTLAPAGERGNVSWTVELETIRHKG